MKNWLASQIAYYYSRLKTYLNTFFRKDREDDLEEEDVSAGGGVGATGCGAGEGATAGIVPGMLIGLGSAGGLAEYAV